jgi:hypothetical protein
MIIKANRSKAVKDETIEIPKAVMEKIPRVKLDLIQPDEEHSVR